MPTDYTNYDSQVNTLGLNENYPVAGQNNPSQGFRDNFAKIKSTFGQVQVELTQLRNYVLRKLEEGEIFEHDNDVNYYKLIRAQLKAYSETFYDIGAADTVVSVNLQNGNFQKVTLTKTADLSLSGFPTTHNAVGRLTLWVTVNNASHRLFIPNDMIYGTAVTYVVNGQIRFPGEGNYLVEIVSVNYANQYWLIGVQGLETGGSGSSSVYQLPVASVSTLGGVKVDGVTIGITNGTIRVIGGGGGGGGVYAVGATGAQGAPGPAGQDTVSKTGNVYSYMYGGAKSTGNDMPFHMVTLTGLGKNGTVELTLSHHSSNVGQSGAYSRRTLITTANLNYLEVDTVNTSFDSGSPTGNIGFELRRPTPGNLEIRWLGNVSTGFNYGFYMALNSNLPLTIHKIGLD